MQAHINLSPLLLHSLTCCELVQQHQVVQLVLANHPPPSHNANVIELAYYLPAAFPTTNKTKEENAVLSLQLRRECNIYERVSVI